jgi:RecB family exonuclease
MSNPETHFLPSSVTSQKLVERFASPSKLQHINDCVGYISDPEETEHAARGKKLHALMEEVADFFHSKYQAFPQQSFNSMQLPYNIIRKANPDDQQDLVTACEALATYMVCPESMTPMSKYTGFTHKKLYTSFDKERCFDMRCLDIPGLIDGTADLVLVEDDGHTCVATIIDYKFGVMPVNEPSKNLQAMAYALTVLHTYPTCQSVTFAFIQPALSVHVQHTFIRADMRGLHTLIKSIVARALAYTDNAEHYEPGSVCQWCARKAECPRVAGLALKIVEGIIDVHTKIHNFHLCVPSDLSRLLDICKVLEPWIEDLKAHATNLTLLNGVVVDNYKRVSRAGHKTIGDTELAWEVCKDHGMGINTFLSACKVSPGKLYDAASGVELDAHAIENALRDRFILTEGQSITYLKREGRI